MSKLKYDIYKLETTPVMVPNYALYDLAQTREDEIKELEYQAGSFDNIQDCINYLEDKDTNFTNGQYLFIPVYNLEK